MDLLENPFHLLGATARDSRERLVELADERSLALAPEACSRARADLSNPRKRLTAEIGWLPGASPKRVNQLTALVQRAPAEVWNLSGLGALAFANLLAASVRRLDPGTPSEVLADWIVRLAELAESIAAEQVLATLNEDRDLARLPPITDLSVVEQELNEQRRYYRAALRAALDKLPSLDLVDAVTKAVDRATESGSRHAPILIDELVDSYEVETKEFIEKEAENVTRLVAEIRTRADSGDDERAVDRSISALEKVVKNWDRIAQPMQVSAKSRGQDHAASKRVAGTIRSLAVDLWNEHQDLDHARRLTTLLQTVFAEVPDFEELLREDAKTLRDLHAQREQTKRMERAERENWERDISYEGSVGVLFKKPIYISAQGIDWEGRRWPFESISRVMWGGTRHSINGIPTGSTYTICFGDHSDLAQVTTRDEGIYSELTDKLWKAVGVRLMLEFLNKLKGGGDSVFSDVVVTDQRVLLWQKRLFKPLVPVLCDWSEIKVWSADGSFCMGCDAKKVQAALSYQQVDNVHVLEAAIRALFKNGGDCLSSLLQS